MGVNRDSRYIFIILARSTYTVVGMGIGGGEVLRARKSPQDTLDEQPGPRHGPRVARHGAKLLPHVPSRLPVSKASEASRNVYHDMLLRALRLYSSKSLQAYKEKVLN